MGILPLVHQNRMRSPRNIRMDCNRKDKLIVLAIEIVEMISPDILNIPCIHEPMAVRRCFDEHHGRQVIDVPIGWDFHQTRLVTFNHRFHPLVCLFGVVDFGPAVSSPEVVCLTVFVAHAVIIFNTVVEQELGALFTGFPPRSFPVR